MRTEAPLPADPARLVAQLRGADIRQRLTDLEAERKALLVLLRTVQARERERARGKAVRDAR
jgi:hypothetical protein